MHDSTVNSVAATRNGRLPQIDRRSTYRYAGYTYTMTIDDPDGERNEPIDDWTYAMIVTRAHKAWARTSSPSRFADPMYFNVIGSNEIVVVRPLRDTDTTTDVV